MSAWSFPSKRSDVRVVTAAPFLPSHTVARRALTVTNLCECHGEAGFVHTLAGVDSNPDISNEFPGLYCISTPFPRPFFEKFWQFRCIFPSRSPYGSIASSFERATLIRVDVE